MSTLVPVGRHLWWKFDELFNPTGYGQDVTVYNAATSGAGATAANKWAAVVADYEGEYGGNTNIEKIVGNGSYYELYPRARSTELDGGGTSRPSIYMPDALNSRIAAYAYSITIEFNWYGAYNFRTLRSSGLLGNRGDGSDAQYPLILYVTGAGNLVAGRGGPYLPTSQVASIVTPIAPNTWYTVEVGWDRTNFYMKLDGNLIDSVPLDSWGGNNYGNLTVGGVNFNRDLSGSFEQFSGAWRNFHAYLETIDYAAPSNAGDKTFTVKCQQELKVPIETVLSGAVAGESISQTSLIPLMHTQAQNGAAIIDPGDGAFDPNNQAYPGSFYNTLLPGGMLNYRSDPGFIGTDSFQYLVEDYYTHPVYPGEVAVDALRSGLATIYIDVTGPCPNHVNPAPGTGPASTAAATLVFDGSHVEHTDEATGITPADPPSGSLIFDGSRVHIDPAEEL